MINYIKYLYFQYYQKANYNIAQFAAEFEKGGRFINNFLQIATFLAVRNINIPTWVLIVAYPIMMLIAERGGNFLIKMGVPKYNNTLANQQSEELMEILAWVRKQK